MYCEFLIYSGCRFDLFIMTFYRISGLSARFSVKIYVPLHERGRPFLRQPRFLRSVREGFFDSIDHPHAPFCLGQRLKE